MTKQLDQLESKLAGTLLDNLSAEASTASIRISFFDSDDPNTARTPHANTKKFCLDPENTQGKKSEWIRCASHSTSNGVTTLSTVTRGLQRDNTVDLTGSASRAQSWDASTTPVGVATEPHNINLMKGYFEGSEPVPGNMEFDGNLQLDGDNAFNGDQTVVGFISMSGSSSYLKFPNLTTAQRTALTGSNGMEVYDTDLGLPYKYVAGAWVPVDTGTVTALAANNTAGKVDIASATEIGAGTNIDAVSGGVNVIPVSQTVKTSSGASDENKLGVLGADGKFPIGFIPPNSIVDIQSFTSDGTWTKPTSYTPYMVMVVAYGGGGGGGGAEGQAAGNIRSGGSGGGGGARVERMFLASDLSATEAVTIGLGGTGGTGGTAANGNSGTSGGNTTFGSHLTAYGGGAGFGGDSTDASGGGGGGFGSKGSDGVTNASTLGGTPRIHSSASTLSQDTKNALGGGGAGSLGGASASNSGGSAEDGGGGGGSSFYNGPATKGSGGGSSIRGAAGGGGGGCITAGNVADLAEDGGASNSFTQGAGGGAATGSSGAAGSNGSDGSFKVGGNGGGGGAAHTAGTGGKGGDGGACGGGGGGGGGGTNVGGAGGDGGDGKVWVISW